MRLFILIACLWTITYSQQSPQEWWAQASKAQRWSIGGSYERNKQYDKGLTLAAFNAIESSGGLHLIRLGENSGGLYAQRAEYVAQRVYKVEKPSIRQISDVIQRLMFDREFDDEQARKHLNELLERYNGDWVKVHQAWNSQKEGQAEEVRRWINFYKYKLKWD